MGSEEAKFRAFIENTEDMICARDRDGGLMFWNESFNEACKNLFGQEAHIGLKTGDLVPPDQIKNIQHIQNSWRRVFEGEKIREEFEYKLPNGETHFFETSWSPIQTGAGIVGAAEITRDITKKKITSDELHHRDEIFKGYMESSTEAIWGFEIDPPMPMELSVDAQLDYLYDHARIAVGNTAWAKQAGYDHWEDMIGLRLDEIVPRSDPENVDAIRQLAESNYHLVDFITHDLTNQGELQISLNNHTPEIKNGYLIRTWGTHRDITEQEEARQKLREAEERYRTVADFTYDWEYWESPEGEMIYVSPSCERISGYEAKAFLDNSDLLEQIIDPEDVDQWNHHRHNASTRTGSTEIEFRIHTKEGEIRWIEHVCQPAYDEEGKFLGIRASNRDVNSRKKAEEELKKKDQLLEDAQRIAHLGSWDWNIITNELVWSDEVYRIFGLSQEKFSATYDAFLERVHPDDRRSLKSAVEQALNDPNTNYNIAHRIIIQDDSERIVRERGNVVFGKGGKPYRMVGTVQDITDIRLMEAETRKLRSEISHMDRVSMMGVLSAGISHEINQPLAAILSNAQAALRFLDKDQPDIKEVKEALQDIVADNKRAGEIVHSIRNIVGKTTIEPEKINLNQTYMEVLSLVNSEMLERKISLTERLQTDIPYIYGNRVQIQQVILNLLMNAMNAVTMGVSESREIMISTCYLEHEGIISRVSDSGPGIKSDQLETIFDSFKTNKTSGLGIGLSICRAIAEKHNGKIWAENRPEGGAVFIFRLPYGEKSNA